MRPPSTVRTCAVMKLDSSLERNRALHATSSGCPTRPRAAFAAGFASAAARSPADPLIEASMSVWMKPGQMALTLMPFGPSSKAIRFVSDITAAFVSGGRSDIETLSLDEAFDLGYQLWPEAYSYAKALSEAA